MENIIIENIDEALNLQLFPTVVMWNRLEGRPRTHHFDKALKAEVRDALWMLTKQWQMGEFKGDDAGSPVFSKVHISASKLDQYRAATHAKQDFEKNIPLEVKAEQKKIPFTRDNKEISIDIRLQMGKYWLKLLKKEGLNFSADYTGAYTFELPENTRAADHIFASRDVWQQYAAISGRCMDGYKLLQYIGGAGKKASDGITATAAEKTALDDLGETFKTWYASVYYQPDNTDDAWLPQQLEYKFSCSASSDKEQKTVSAEEYYQGHLDWYAFDMEENTDDHSGEAKDTFTQTFIPSHVKFDGMPDTRWWRFEDGKTSLGDVRPSTTDLSKLLLMEFGLVFANDWFIIPYTLPTGSLAMIEGLTVKNNFGETTWIQPTEKADASGQRSWSMFKLKSEEQNNTLFLAPSLMKAQEGKALEEVMLIRDEMSNMVWGIESVIPLSTGKGEKGNETALFRRQFHEKAIALLNDTKAEAEFHLASLDALSSLNAALTAAKTDLTTLIAALDAANPNANKLAEDLEKVKDVLSAEGELQEYKAEKETSAYNAKISYLAMTDVPENWIPFIPVHKKNDNRETQLQRSSSLRIIEGDTLNPAKIKPLTSILRQGLENDVPAAYYIHEEEVPRAGARVLQSFQRTRWTNGEVFVWLGMKKKTGKGEGSSGLAFDQIKDV